jgi:hypothetical protein
MASASPPAKHARRSEVFYGRLLDYIKQTGIKFKAAGRHGAWTRLGLPDMRGFTPHLRTVRLNAEDDPSPFLKKKSFSSLTERQLWLVHDLLHIIFYDFATLNLGLDHWLDEARFMESHLASEAFAVLALDYQLIPGSLASQFQAGNWKTFQKILPGLPDYDSGEFCTILSRHYMGIPGGFLEKVSLKKKPSKGIEKKFHAWLGHERRYAEKQLSYTQMWRYDLALKPLPKKGEAIESSFVDEGVWELIRMATGTEGENEVAWSDFVSGMRRPGRSEVNYFSDFPKFSEILPLPDFRFTDMRSMSQTQIAAILEKASNPSPSNLFLFWQILASTDPRKIGTGDRKQVALLAKESAAASARRGLSKRRWGHVRSLCEELLKVSQWSPDPRERAVFFLP